MSNLFSIFDPVSWLSFNLNWMSFLLVLIFLPPVFWVSGNQSMMLLSKITKILKKEFSATLNFLSVPGFLLISLALFIFVLINNVPGLLPYVFTASSHPTFTLTLALPLWLGHMMMAILKTPASVLAHLVPMSTPAFLVPFMVIVEVISSLIRPVTLAVRLAANMIAGHLLMALLGGMGQANMVILLSVLSGLTALFMLELAVSLIQAYVFSVLSTLFINEVNSPKISYFKKS